MTLLDPFFRELRFAGRILRKNPGFSVVATLTLALAVGANTAMFSVAESILSKPLPFFRPDRLVEVYERTAQQHWHNISAPDFLDWRARNKVFDQLAGYGWSERSTLTGVGPAEQVRVAAASANLLETLGVQPMFGRDFLPNEESGGRNRVAIISYELWERDFAAKPTVVGLSIRLDDQPYTVVGILPRLRFEIEEGVDAFVPFDFTSADLRRRDKRDITAIARLKDGISLAQARADMLAIAGQLASDYPATNHGWSAGIDPLLDAVTGWSRTSVLLFFTATIVLLLISCAGLANLVLSRSLARQGEFAIRRAQGAAIGDVARLLLVEVLSVGVLGGALAVFIAAWGVRLFVAILPAGYFPRVDEIAMDSRAFAFALAIALTMAALSAIGPVSFASRVDLNETLKQAGRALAGGALGQRSRRLLVSAEVALAMLLLFSASLFVNSYIRLNHASLGFDRGNLLSARISTPSRNWSAQQISLFYNQLFSRIAAIPGARTVLAASHGPLNTMEGVTFRIEGQPLPDPARMPDALDRVVTPGYFNTLKIPLLRGREFTRGDTYSSPRVAIINANLAHQYFPSEDPLGKRLILISGDAGIRLGSVQIVGVVANTAELGPNEVPFGDVYLPFEQHPFSSMDVLIRTAVPAASIAPAVVAAVHAFDAAAPVSHVETFDERFEHKLDGSRFNMFLLESFAFIAALLAAVSLFGVISQSVTQRTHDIGVRMALGARAADAVRFVLGDSLRLTLAGMGSGVAIALIIGRLLGGALYLVPYQHEGMIYQVSMHDPLMFAITSVALIALTLAATYVPARRAARVDPMVALRYE